MEPLTRAQLLELVELEEEIEMRENMDLIMDSVATAHETTDHLETIHQGISVKMFSETAVTLLLSYEVEDEAILRTAATGLVEPDDTGAVGLAAHRQSGGLSPYRQLFTCPSLLSSSWWGPSLHSLLAHVTQLEESDLAALQAMLLVSTMFLTGHKPAGLSLHVAHTRALARDKSLEGGHVSRRLGFILALSGQINSRTGSSSELTPGKWDRDQLGKIHEEIVTLVARF